jgi:hypothetical protein
LVILAAAACSATRPTKGTPGDSGTEPADGRFEVSGVVLGLDGTPVVDVFVTVSTEFCVPDRTDETGTFAVQEVDSGAKRLITYGETAANGLFASVAFAFDANDGLAFDTPVWTPELTSWAVDDGAVEDQTVATEDGLELTIPTGALTLAPFAPAEVQAARVPVDQAPPFVPDGVELVDLFALGPILSTFEPPAPVAFPADSGLPVGTPVVFHSLDYETGLLVEVAHGTVDETGRPATSDGEGIPELTWVGISLE